MIRGLYIAGTSLVTNNEKVNAISNNIANIETAGYKRDDVTTESFNSVLMAKFNGSKFSTEGRPGTIDIKIEDGDYEVSTINGFFRIQTDTGISHNKELKFSVDEEGFLSTYFLNSNRSKNWHLGDRIVGNDGNQIRVGVDTDYTVSDNGDIVVNGEVINNIVKETGKHVIGTVSAGVKLTRVFTDFQQGQISRTGRSLDFALDGEGFFVIDTPFGEVYTRNGQFKTDASQKLMTAEGYQVQGFDGSINIESPEITINDFGEILYNNQIIDKFKTVNVTNTGDLVKLGGGYFRLKNEVVGETVDFEGKIVQFSKEQSNSDAITEMISMMTLQRNYEASQKVILTHDNILDKAVNTIGRI